MVPAELADLAENFWSKITFRKFKHFVLLFCYRHESGRKYTSTIFLPTSEPILMDYKTFKEVIFLPDIEKIFTNIYHIPSLQ